MTDLYNPELEGVTHINAYSKSKCTLGRLLSNFAFSPFSCSDGKFNSIEGYWYWLIASSGNERESLRKLSGFKAKQVGRQLTSEDWNNTKEFEEKIKKACWQKLKGNSLLRHLLRKSNLPIVHYYVYGNPPKIIIPKDGKWLWEWYTCAQQYLKDYPDEQITKKESCCWQYDK